MLDVADGHAVLLPRRAPIPPIEVLIELVVVVRSAQHGGVVDQRRVVEKCREVIEEEPSGLSEENADSECFVRRRHRRPFRRRAAQSCRRSRALGLRERGTVGSG